MRVQIAALLLGLFSIVHHGKVMAWTTTARTRSPSTHLHSTRITTLTTTKPSVRVAVRPATPSKKLSAQEIVRRRDAQLEKMRLKDQQSPLLTPEQLNIVFQDKHIIVVDKPSGVLTVSGKHGAHSLVQSVAAACHYTPDRMVVHRLGMDTSGLLIFAKNDRAVRGMHTVFRVRKIQRTYEALVCGHVEKEKGMIDLPLMMDYEHPPFVRISTDEHQENLIGLDPEDVGKKLLEKPKESITRYEVLAREELQGEPVTRVKLTSVSGRYHQLNCHLAALGHPIVGDRVYGIDGEAAPNGGLRDDELGYLVPNKARASEQVQRNLLGAMDNKVCCHARGLRFLHPVKRLKVVELTSPPPF